MFVTRVETVPDPTEVLTIYEGKIANRDDEGEISCGGRIARGNGQNLPGLKLPLKNDGEVVCWHCDLGVKGKVMSCCDGRHLVQVADPPGGVA